MPNARAISRLPTGVSLWRMNSINRSRVGRPGGRLLLLGLRGTSASGARGCLELDFDEDELVLVRIDDVVLDADRPVVGLADRHVGEPLFLAVPDEQLPRGQRHHDIVVAVAVPAGRFAGREAPFGDDQAIVL